jgi:hypothetical protein
MSESSFTDYSTHFTVNNYGEGEMTNIRCEEFMKQFDEEYKDRVSFEQLNEKIYHAIS